jgi:glycosyltransferase involved in cell wall biosynthesis
MPVYNGENFLEQALESILSQTYTNFELIISDNASEDRTEEICRRYVEKDIRISYHRSDRNRGSAWNYNRVFQLSSGEYFKWWAHDDLCEPTYLERCMEVFNSEDSSVVLCYPKTILIDGKGKIMDEYEDKLDLSELRAAKRLTHFISNVRLCNAVFGLIKRDALAKTRLIDSFISSDEVLLAELALLGRFFEIPERLFFRRYHEYNSWQGNKDLVDKAAWYSNKNRKKKFFLRRNRLFFEILRSIFLSELNFGEKIYTAFTFSQKWLKLHWLEMGSEGKSVFKYYTKQIRFS